jgi:hypothetical protein
MVDALTESGGMLGTPQRQPRVIAPVLGIHA